MRIAGEIMRVAKVHECNRKEKEKTQEVGKEIIYIRRSPRQRNNR